MYSLPDGTLQKVVDAGDHEELVFVFLHIDHSLVGVDHLLQVRTLHDEMREGSILVVVGIDLPDLLDGIVAFGIGCHEDSA